MEGFKSYSGYTVGASHIAKNMGCEDYASTYDDEKVCIAAISDGHGDKKCFRSAQGARMACDISINCVRKLIESSPTACETLKKSPDRIITELEKEIIRKWNNCVSNDLLNNQITSNELNSLPEDAIEEINTRRSLNKIYGCTLIMCVVIEGFWFGIHIGDGKCVVAMNNGLYTQPIPWDEVGCVGNRSTSICNSNSFAGFRYTYGTDVPVGIFVASDGVDESFDESGLNRCYYTLGYWVQTMQIEELDSKMEELLSQITNNGSGDDVSIACILSTKNDIKKPYASSEQVAEKLKELIDNIKENEIQVDNLTESKKEASDSLSILKTEIDVLKRKVSVLEEQITDKEQEITNIDKNLYYVLTQLQKSVTQLPKAKETKERIDQYWKGNGVDIKENADLNYAPRYSDDIIEKVMAEIKRLHKDETANNMSEASDRIDNRLKGKIDNNTVIDDDLIDSSKTDTKESKNAESIIVSPAENFGKNITENNRQVIDKDDPPAEDIGSKSQKNHFFKGLFKRKK